MKRKWLVNAVIVSGLSFAVYLGVKTHSDSGRNFPNNNDIPYGSSLYTQYAGKVYYNKAFKGYFLVKQADAVTFKPLGLTGSIMLNGADQNHVYFKTEVIPDLKPAEVIYLQSNYCTDGRKVFYGANLITGADPASFVRVNGYYATDKNHAYYKGEILKDADVKTFTNIKIEGRERKRDFFMRDKTHVYYKDILIKGANPENFVSLDTEQDDGWGGKFSFDGQHYFYQENIILLSNSKEKTKGLKLLMLDQEYAFIPLFYKASQIYYFDVKNEELVLLGERDSKAPLISLERGLFKDDKHVYFTIIKEKMSVKRRLAGRHAGLIVAQHINPADFKAVGQVKAQGNYANEGTIYQSGSKRYFHHRFPQERKDGNPATPKIVFALIELRPDYTEKELSLENAFTEYIKIDKWSVSWKGLLTIFKKDVDHNED